MNALLKWLRFGSDAEHDLAVAFVEFAEGDSKSATGSLLQAGIDFMGKDSKAGKAMTSALQKLVDTGLATMPTATVQPATAAQPKP